MLAALLLTSFLTLVELNCENLFDCRRDSLKNDTEFLPDSPRQWKRWKYWRKLDLITKEIMACGEDSMTSSLPAIVALSEVENDSVMIDLTRRSALRSAGYNYVMTDSPDERGIDVALMYHRFSFLPISHRSIRVDPVANMRPTRDILYVEGKVVSGDTLHIFVVHAPSRRGGERRSRPFRKAVMERLCSTLDSLRASHPFAKIIITGDFNEPPEGRNLQSVYRRGMHNVTRNAHGENGARGTYRYKGKWELIDHVLVSQSLKNAVVSSRIFDAPFLLVDDERYGGVKPRRSYPSFRYDSQGFSDHLPLVVRFKLSR